MMELTIKGVRDEGDLFKERLLLQVAYSCEIGSYVVLKGQAVNTLVSNTVTNAFWFPDKRVNVGDLVVLYTKSGINKQKINTNGSTSHFFYWNLPLPIWKGDGVTVLVMKIAEWSKQVLIGSEDQE